MRIDGIQITEGGAISNLSVKTGTAFPSSPNAGELFFRTDALTTTKGLYVYSGTAWTRIQSELQLVSPVVTTLPTEFIQGTSVYLNSGDLNEGFYIYDTVSGWIGVSKPTPIIGDLTGTINPGTSSSLILNTITNSNTGSLLKFNSNAKGLITGTTAVTTSDLTALLNTSYASLSGSTFSGPIVTQAGMYDAGSFVRILSPNGASFDANAASNTGAIKIKLPQNNSSTMMMFEVKVFNYSSLNGQGTSRTFQIGGYNYSGGGWINYFASELSASTTTPLNVRFGFDSTTDCIWIGETTSTWSWLKVTVTQFQGGFSMSAPAWVSGWNISLQTTFDTVEQTIASSLSLNSNNFSTYALPLTGGVLTGNSSLSLSNTASTSFSIINNNTGVAADSRLIVSNGTNTGGVIIRGTGYTSVPNRVTLYSSAGLNSAISLNVNGIDSVVLNTTSFTSSVPFVGSLTGNASTATSLQTGRTISLTGDATGTSSAFDGSANASIPVTLANSGVTTASYGTGGSIPVITFNAKGLATSASTTPVILLNSLSATDANLDQGPGFRSLTWSAGSSNFPTTSGTGFEARRSSGSSSDMGTFQVGTSTDSSSALYYRKVTGYSAGDTWSSWNQILFNGFPYIQAVGLSTTWGTTSGTSTGAVNAIQGAGAMATWLVSGTSAGTFRGGIQLLDAGGIMRLYSSPTTFAEINGASAGFGTSPTLIAGYTTVEAKGTSSGAGGIFQSTASDSAAIGRFYAVGSTTNTLFISTTTATPISIRTNNAERIGITAAGAVSIPGALSVTGGVTASVTGNASTATALLTGRTFSLTGDATGTSAAFDGSAATAIPVTLASVATAGTSTKVTYDAKGRVTSGTALAATDIPSLDWSKITTGKPTTLSGYGISDVVTNSITPAWVTGTGTYANRYGSISVCGRNVTVNILIEWSGWSGSSNCTIQLPYASEVASGILYTAIFNVMGVNFSWPGGATQLVGTVASGSNFINLFGVGTAGMTQISTVPASGLIVISGSYTKS